MCSRDLVPKTLVTFDAELLFGRFEMPSNEPWVSGCTVLVKLAFVIFQFPFIIL